MISRSHLVILRLLAENFELHPEEARALTALGLDLRTFLERLTAADDPTGERLTRFSATQWPLWRQAREAVRAEPQALGFCWHRAPDNDDKGTCRHCGFQITDAYD